MKETTVRKIVFLAAQTLWMNAWETDFYNEFWFTCICDIMEQLDDEPTIQDFCKRINDVLCDGEFLSHYTKLTGISQEQIETAFEIVENNKESGRQQRSYAHDDNTRHCRTYLLGKQYGYSIR